MPSKSIARWAASRTRRSLNGLRPLTEEVRSSGRAWSKPKYCTSDVSARLIRTPGAAASRSRRPGGVWWAAGPARGPVEEARRGLLGVEEVPPAAQREIGRHVPGRHDDLLDPVDRVG